MISAVHTIIYSRDAEADRTFLRDILGFPSVDAGGGWLVFALPPGELAVHPAEVNDRHEFYLMCDDVEATIAELRRKGVECGSIDEQPWGRLTQIHLPGGGALGLYQPTHPVAAAMAA